jgi:proline iminopeptidase
MPGAPFLNAYREEYLEPIPEEERGDMVKAYHSRLNSEDESIRLKAARAWSKWE